ncbi:hypothetical protein OV090_35205 [Nannocystis sp. RBIL2]|uniref:RCC1 domain-containing protein n=1 Tax=Nannocystis sp. RBIL2 TaxID=2996788 RepID=UPI002270B1DE|nr:hypothetical protein [Nannocystis sp. RBIL2]MCY1070045.1 hypothetical protein [Nannocystis sp. RBIL2]
MRTFRLALGCLLALSAACADRGREPTGSPPAIGDRDGDEITAAGPTLALGVGHTCALQGGEVYCWGYGAHGQLGLGDRRDRSEPTRVPGLADVVALAAGTWHTCALRRGGDVLCWGDGSLGQVGDGALGTRPRPSPVAGLRARAIAAGGSHTCAIDHVRKVLCWGSNYRGESGDGRAALARPTAVPGVPAADAVVVGDPYACALAGGDVTCWGADPLRDGHDTAATELPALAGAVRLAAGSDHLCAVGRDDRVLCIGTGSEGQLGDGQPPAPGPAHSPHGIATPRPRAATTPTSPSAGSTTRSRSRPVDSTPAPCGAAATSCAGATECSVSSATARGPIARRRPACPTSAPRARSRRARTRPVRSDRPGAFTAGATAPAQAVDSRLSSSATRLPMCSPSARRVRAAATESASCVAARGCHRSLARGTSSPRPARFRCHELAFSAALPRRNHRGSRA